MACASRPSSRARARAAARAGQISSGVTPINCAAMATIESIESDVAIARPAPAGTMPSRSSVVFPAAASCIVRSELLLRESQGRAAFTWVGLFRLECNRGARGSCWLCARLGACVRVRRGSCEGRTASANIANRQQPMPPPRRGRCRSRHRASASRALLKHASEQLALVAEGVLADRGAAGGARTCGPPDTPPPRRRSPDVRAASGPVRRR
jgi:hypothetical protein